MAKIFFVHQYPDELDLVLRKLKAADHQTVVYFRGIGISNAIAKELPDLVIVDIDRGLVDGVALCALIRQTPRIGAIPILLLSNTLFEAELRRKVIDAGAQGGLSRTAGGDQMVLEIFDFLRRKRPLLPANEAKRLQNLRNAHVLDTPAEAVFDDLCRVAAIVCETPIAVVSLVDETRQWFKARIGLGATETPRDQAFCAHAIHGTELMEVPDATRDVRFENNPLVTADPNIRFYAGAPLTAADGTAAGTLCVIDRAPRHLRPPQREALTALSRVVTHLLAERSSSARPPAEPADSAVSSRR
jgi:CheY-like chemotaxis protein